MSDDGSKTLVSNLLGRSNSGEEEPETVMHYMSITIVNQSPSHKYRLTIVDPEVERVLYVADLRFAKNDDSIYLIPHITREYTLQVPDTVTGKVTTLTMKPGRDLHLSIHESGAINLTAGKSRVSLRAPQQERSREGRLLDIMVNAFDSLRCATLDEVNSLPSRYKQLPLIGLLGLGPICLTMFRVKEGKPWKMPALSDMMQLHFEIKFQGKNMVYHFVMWQNPRISTRPGDVSFWT